MFAHVSSHLSAIRAQHAAFAALVAALDPGSVPLPDAAPAFALFDAIERLAGAGKLLLAERVEASRVWQREGFRSAADYLAATTKTPVGRAREALQTSGRVREQPAVAEALQRGELNVDQATAVSDAAAADPAAAADLLATAQRDSLHELRRRCDHAKAAADPDLESRRRRIHRDRHVRTFVAPDGSWNLHARGTVEDGARVEAALKPFTEARFTHARRDRERESHDAYRFDAFVAMATGTDGEHRPVRARDRYRTLVRADLTALTRGHAIPGETCEVAGVGPISVAGLRDLLGASTLELVLTRGEDVLNVTYLGRGPSAAQKAGLLWNQPRCAREGCNRTILQADHREDFARTHHTRLDELDHLCKPDHDLKTYRGWALVPGTGRRPMVPPGDPRHPDNRAVPEPNRHA